MGTARGAQGPGQPGPHSSCPPERPRTLLLLHRPPLNYIQVLLVLNSTSSPKWERKEKSHGLVLRYTHSHTTRHPGAQFCLSRRGKKGIPRPPTPTSRNKQKCLKIFEKTTSVDRIPPLGFLQLLSLTC